MKSMLIIFVALLGLNFLTSYSQAAIDVYAFSSDEQREQYHLVIKELRCPKCQNQDIADSNAPIAKDMRREVHRLVEEGKSLEFIVDFMVERFGDFVSYRPKVAPSTYLLWFGPLFFALLGLVVVIAVSRKLRKQRKGPTGLETTESARLQDLLQEDELTKLGDNAQAADRSKVESPRVKDDDEGAVSK